MILANPKIELALLATCLEGGSDVARAAAADIEPDDFHELDARNVWRVILDLLDKGEAVDLVGLDRRWPKLIEGAPRPPQALFEAMTMAGTASDLPAHVSEVKEWARRRTVHAQALKLAGAAQNPKSDVEEAVASCQNSLRLPPTADEQNVSPRRAVEIHMADLEERHQLQGKLSGISTGLSQIDESTDGLQRGELSVFGARPSHGKSALLLGFAHHAALVLGVPVLFLSMEMSVPMLMRRLNALDTGISLRAMKRGQLTERDFARTTAFNNRMLKAPLWFYRGNAAFNITKARNLVRRHVEENGVRLVMVDYLQRLPAVTRREKRTYEVGEVSTALQTLALELNISVCAAAQLSRDPDKAHGKEEGRLPKICDLADSAQIDRDGDLICLLHRPKMGEEANLIVAKQRDGEYANQHLWFDADRCKFSEAKDQPINP